MYKLLLITLITLHTISIAKENKMSLQPYSTQALTIQPNTIYTHYKGDRYKIIAIARIEATLEEVVVYQLESNPELTWVRPVSLFTEDIEYNGKTVKRFTLNSQ